MVTKKEEGPIRTVEVIDPLLVAIVIILAIVMIIMVIVMVIEGTKMANYINIIEEQNQTIYDLNLDKKTLQMGCYNNTTPLFTNTSRIDGIAFPSEGYFCVYSAGSSFSDVLATCAHEWAHVNEGLIHEERCKE